MEQPNDTFGFAELQKELETDEGRKNFPYLDTVGLTSIGIGRNLTGRGLADDEVDYLFHNDVALCCDVMDENIPWWRGLPPNAQRVMINLCFMGWHSFSQFTHFLAYMKAGDFVQASVELQNSRWWNQVGLRGPRVKARLLSRDVTPSA